jgi:hypothetical protein
VRCHGRSSLLFMMKLTVCLCEWHS